MGTPDDVQAAAKRLANLEGYTLVEEFGSNVWNHLVDLGWIPPGDPDVELWNRAYAEGQASGHQAGYSEGLLAGSTSKTVVPVSSPTAWTPCELRWRHTLAGDVFVGEDGEIWSVVAHTEKCDIGIHEAKTIKAAEVWEGQVDPDETINVLLPAAEARAIIAARTELGATIVGRTRT